MNRRSWIAPHERIEYYLNRQSSFDLHLNRLKALQEKNQRMKNEVRYIAYDDYKGSFLNWYCKVLMPLPFIREIRALPFYEKYRNLHSLMDFLRPFQHIYSKNKACKYPIYYGEVRETDGLPIIRKSRKVSDTKSILYDMRSLRYNTPCIKVTKQDVTWQNKKHDVVWRGATTGKLTRENFVKTYYEKYNIGFSSVKQKPQLASYKKEKISISDQLHYRFIVSLQGNDLASNIRWVLHSNSVPIMPKPMWTSWTMESKLEPYVHYLPLNDDLSNLDELLTWAQNHNRDCQEIAANGKHFVSQFLDQDYDNKIRMMLLDEFASRLNVIHDETESIF